MILTHSIRRLIVRAGAHTVPISENKAIARKFFEEFDRRDFTAIQSLLAPDEVSHLPGAPQLLDWPAHQQYATAFVSAFPDSHHVVEDQLADHDHVVTRLTFGGTHTGDLMGVPATGRSIAIGAIAWLRTSNGRIAEEWTQLRSARIDGAARCCECSGAWITADT
jgi:steroid delta-isomerase-like uncharacterized protein